MVGFPTFVKWEFQLQNCAQKRSDSLMKHRWVCAHVNFMGDCGSVKMIGLTPPEAHPSS
jgi:hypothetical protein